MYKAFVDNVSFYLLTKIKRDGHDVVFECRFFLLLRVLLSTSLFFFVATIYIYIYECCRGYIVTYVFLSLPGRPQNKFTRELMSACIRIEEMNLLLALFADGLAIINVRKGLQNI